MITHSTDHLVMERLRNRVQAIKVTGSVAVGSLNKPDIHHDNVSPQVCAWVAHTPALERKRVIAPEPLPASIM